MVKSFRILISSFCKKLSIACINIYKYIIAPYIPNCCRFNISCSDYTKSQIEQFGTVCGIFKGICRLLQCNPLIKVKNE